MPRLGERDEKILDFIVRDYIRSAFPISSNRVFRGVSLEVSPATIRNAMLELDQEGYLVQPHTSAGRVPTDKAYRYFVDWLIEYEGARKEEKVFIDEVLRKIYSRHLGLFTTIASFGRRTRIASFGFEEVLKEPEFEVRELLMEFGKLADNLERAAEHYLEASVWERPKAFIGRENPDVNTKDFGAVSMKFKDDKSGEGVIFSLGPKRMNYEEIFRVYGLWTRF